MTADPPRSASDYADALSGVLEHADHMAKVQAGKKERGPSLLSRPPVVIGVFMTFVAVIAFNVVWSRPPPGADAGPAAAPVGQAVPASLVATVAVVEAYEAEHGQLPESLEEVGVGTAGLVYRRGSDGGFVLEATGSGESLRYDSRGGPEAILEALGVPAGVIR